MEGLRISIVADEGRSRFAKLVKVFGWPYLRLKIEAKSRKSMGWTNYADNCFMIRWFVRAYMCHFSARCFKVVSVLQDCVVNSGKLCIQM